MTSLRAAALAVVVGSAIAWLAVPGRGDDVARVRTRTPIVAQRQSPSATRVALGPAVAGERDALARYAALRDDANPVPRLRLIEDWARERRRDESLELLGHALVDPDARVRERAQVLFDAALVGAAP